MRPSRTVVGDQAAADGQAAIALDDRDLGGDRLAVEAHGMLLFPGADDRHPRGAQVVEERP